MGWGEGGGRAVKLEKKGGKWKRGFGSEVRGLVAGGWGWGGRGEDYYGFFPGNTIGIGTRELFFPFFLPRRLFSFSISDLPLHSPLPFPANSPLFHPPSLLPSALPRSPLTQPKKDSNPRLFFPLIPPLSWEITRKDDGGQSGSESL